MTIDLMKIMSQFLIVAIFACICNISAIGANSVLWAGIKYSVAVVHLGIEEEDADMPFPKTLQMPDFPIEAMKAGISGSVTVAFLIDEDGCPRAPRVIEGGIGVLEESVKRTVLKWSFAPPRLLKERTRLVPVNMRCRFEFRAIEPGDEGHRVAEPQGD